MRSRRQRLPAEYRTHWARHRSTIRRRLSEFRSVPPEQYFYELVYCLLTPQSKAAHVEWAIRRLQQLGFPDVEVDTASVLRSPAHYVRFHNSKGHRLLELRRQWPAVSAILASEWNDGPGRRDWLVANVVGLGWKEASHFLRNIGHLELAIIDRHVLKHLHRCGAIDAIPRSITRKRYLDLEQRFVALASSFGLTLQELDLLFWSFEEGSVRK